MERECSLLFLLRHNYIMQKMKHTTLREHYETKKKIHSIVAEEFLIIEATENAAKTAEVLKKLTTISNLSKRYGMVQISAAIKKASDEVNAFSGGDVSALLKKGIASVQQKLGAKAGSNPLLKAETFLSSLEHGFSELPALIQNNVPQYKEKSKKSPLEQIRRNDKTVAKNLAKATLKAFTPVGVYSSLASMFGTKGGGIPYIEDSQIFVKNVLDTPAQDLAQMISAVTASNVSKAAEPEAKEALKSAGNPKAEDKGTKSDKFFSSLLNKVMERPELKGASEDTVKAVLSVIDDFRAKGKQ